MSGAVLRNTLYHIPTSVFFRELSFLVDRAFIQRSQLNERASQVRASVVKKTVIIN